MSKKKPLVLFVLLLCTLVLGSSCQLDILPKSDTTVHIIGVALDYYNVGANLNGTIRDVTEFITAYEYYLDRAGINYQEKYFIQKGETPDMSHEEYPSADNVRSYIRNLDVSSEDLILFVYSGHGTYDTQKEKAAIVLAATEEEMLPLFYVDELFDLLDSKGCQALAVMDNCNSGGMAENWDKKDMLSGAFESLFEKTKYKGLHVITASSEDELSYEFGSGNGETHGAFTYQLLNYMGWFHSDYVFKTISSCGNEISVHGVMSAPRQNRMLLKDFYLYAISGMDKTRQHPQINKTNSDLVFLP